MLAAIQNLQLSLAKFEDYLKNVAAFLGKQQLDLKDCGEGFLQKRLKSPAIFTSYPWIGCISVYAYLKSSSTPKVLHTRCAVALKLQDTSRLWVEYTQCTAFSILGNRISF